MPALVGQEVVTVVLYALPDGNAPTGWLEYEDADYIWFTGGKRRRDRCRG